jgi:dUTP pyrophosphatase
MYRNDNLKLKIIRESAEVKLPTRANPTDSGLDLYVYKFKKLYHGKAETVKDISKDNEVILRPLDRVLIDTGIKATVSPGYELQVRPKSGRSLKEGLTVLNSPGTIDESYCENIGVIIVNLSAQSRKLILGEKVAQLVIQRIELLDIEEVTELGNGNRSGFGSTGIK